MNRKEVRWTKNVELVLIDDEIISICVEVNKKHYAFAVEGNKVLYGIAYEGLKKANLPDYSTLDIDIAFDIAQVVLRDIQESGIPFKDF